MLTNKDLPVARGTLVIAAMQAGIESARAHNQIDAVELLLVRCLRAGYNVVLAEQGPVGHFCPTLPALTGWLDGYERVERIEVRGLDAGHEIIEACNRRGFTTKEVVFAGANIGGLIVNSVFSVAARLSESDPEAVVEVRTAAVNDRLEEGPVDFGGVTQHADFNVRLLDHLGVN